MLGEAAQRFEARGQALLPALDAAVLRQLVAALLVAALLETSLLRLVTRIGVHLPKEGVVADVYQVAPRLGSFAFNLASVLSIVLAVLVLGLLVLRLQSTVARVGLAAISVAMLWSLGLSLTSGGAAADAVFGLSMTLLVGLLGLVFVRQDGGSGRAPARVRVPLALIVASYLCYQYYTLGYLLYDLLDYTAVPPLSLAALHLGEGLVVVAGLAVFWAWGIDRWRRIGLVGWLAAVGVVLAIALAGSSPGSTVSILALWTTGLSFVLPFPIYLLALGLYLLTLAGCLRSGDSFWTASGLVLVLLAGYMPEATYHHLLLLLGVACLSGALRLALPAEGQTLRAAETAAAQQ